MAKKNKVIPVRLDESDYSNVKLCAEADGLSAGTWLRLAVQKALKSRKLKNDRPLVGRDARN